MLLLQVRRRDMGKRMHELFDKAELTEAQASELLAQLQSRYDSVKAAVTKQAEEANTDDQGEQVVKCTWPQCHVCTYVNEVQPIEFNVRTVAQCMVVFRLAHQVARCVGHSLRHRSSIHLPRRKSSGNVTSAAP